MRARERDQWAQWLLHRRHGGDPEQLRQTLAYLRPIRDCVLDHDKLAPGETLLDVGCGDGLIAFGALERVGDQGKVIVSGISQDLLNRVRAINEALQPLAADPMLDRPVVERGKG